MLSYCDIIIVYKNIMVFYCILSLSLSHLFDIILSNFGSENLNLYRNTILAMYWNVPIYYLSNINYLRNLNTIFETLKSLFVLKTNLGKYNAP